MALHYLIDFPHTIPQILFCVDSKTALYSLNTMNFKVRPEIVIEITHLIHILSLRGCNITFCWIPSDCNFYFNNVVDAAAKHGARGIDESTSLNTPLSVKEWFCILEKHFRKLNNIFPDFDVHNVSRSTKHFCNNLFQHKQVVSLACRWKANAFKTKYVANIKCICNHALTPDHIAACLLLRTHIPILGTSSMSNIFNIPSLLFHFLLSLLHSPIGTYV